tara:strand:- start:352 stop:1074 length:723 start_codon:yes stop_codon:yes gene_type:complete
VIERIFIIGDSFCDGIMHDKSKNLSYKDMHWVNYLDYHYENTEVINDAFGSRDLQSMIDYWIKLFPILTEKDRVIIGLADGQRQRIPIEDEKDYRKLVWSGGVCKNMFLTRQWWEAYKDFKTTSASDVFSENDMDKMLDFLEVMNQSKTTSKNYKEVIESLYKVAPCKTYLFSWHDHTKYETPKASCVEDKVDLTEKLGMWTTRHILYNESNGEEGLEHDHHWDYRTMESFGNYVIDKIK